jgi:hypothetical protein
MRVLGVGATRTCLNIFGSMNRYGRHLPHKGGIAVEGAIFDIKTIALAVIRDSGLAQVSVIEKAAIIYVKHTIIVCEMAKDRGIGGAAGIDKRTALNVKLKRLVTNAVTARGNTVIARHMTEIAVFDGYFRVFNVGSIARETVGHIAEAENLRRVVVAETVDIDFGGVSLNKGYAVVEIAEIGKTAVFNVYSAVERRAVLNLGKFVKRPSARTLVNYVFEGEMSLFAVGAKVSYSYVPTGKAVN